MAKRQSTTLRVKAVAHDKAPKRAAERSPRADGRFDLPVVTGRTPKQVARRLA